MAVRWAALVTVAAACPHGHLNEQVCSGHGHCARGVAPGVDETCVCDAGFVAADCSQRACPAGRAWADYATANNTAHALHFECSNQGHCDRDSGECECREGFTGEACSRMRCPVGAAVEGGPLLECSGVGRCLSMREAATQRDWVSLTNAPEPYDDWDADMVRGGVGSRPRNASR